MDLLFGPAFPAVLIGALWIVVLAAAGVYAIRKRLNP